METGAYGFAGPAAAPGAGELVRKGRKNPVRIVFPRRFYPRLETEARKENVLLLIPRIYWFE